MGVNERNVEVNILYGIVCIDQQYKKMPSIKYFLWNIQNNARQLLTFIVKLCRYPGWVQVIDGCRSEEL